MRDAVPTGLPQVSPISWATVCDRLLCTAHVPLRADGTFETGPTSTQLRQTFANLGAAMDAAGGSLADVLQVVVYLVDVNDFPTLNEVWVDVFAEPRPSRAVVGCSALAVDGVRVTITATACLPHRPCASEEPARPDEPA